MWNSREFDGYELTGTLSSKAETQVHRGQRSDDTRSVVLKVFRDPTNGRGLPDLFDHEREVRSKLAGVPGLAPVIHEDTTRSGVPFLVMPYYDGRILADLVMRSPVEVEDALVLVDVLGETVQGFHDRGLVHTGLSVTDVYVADEIVLVGGLTGVAASGRAAAARSGAGLAPELASGAAPGVQSDVYGLGAVLHRCLTAMRPNGAILPPIDDPEVPRHLSDAIARAVALDPADRFDSVGDFLKAIRAEPVRTENPTPAPEVQSTGQADEDPSDDRTVMLDDSLIAQIRAANEQAMPASDTPDETVVVTDDVIGEIRAAQAQATPAVKPGAEESDATVVVNDDLIREIRHEAQQPAPPESPSPDTTLAASDDLVREIRDAQRQSTVRDQDIDDATIAASTDLVNEIRTAQADPNYRIKPKMDEFVPREPAVSPKESVGRISDIAPPLEASTGYSEADNIAELRRKFSPEARQKPQGFLPKWLLFAGAFVIVLLIVVVIGVVIVG